MLFDTNIPLKNFNSFGFDAIAQKAVHILKPEDLIPALQECQAQQWPWRVLGGGSNVVLTEHLEGLTLLMGIKGRQLVDQNESHWIIQAGAGENWHDFVAWTLAQGWPGLENLALIPGTCGAAPIQNIGAYGSEVAQFIQTVNALDTTLLGQPNPWVEINTKDCAFSYRDSIFKHEPNRYIVTHVNFAIPKNWIPNLNYAELAKFAQSQTEQRTPKQIFDEVCRVRQSKLPDPKVIGNAGSFFHNPIVDDAKHNELKTKFPGLVSYPAPSINEVNDSQQYKLAAGWLIDQCGFKGMRLGNVGVYDKQALVLVNHGSGTSTELLELARRIKEKIHAVYGVDLIQEPVIFS